MCGQQEPCLSTAANQAFGVAATVGFWLPGFALQNVSIWVVAAVQ